MAITRLPIGDMNCLVSLSQGPHVTSLRQIEYELMTHPFGRFVAVVEKEGDASGEIKCTLAVVRVDTFDDHPAASLSIKQDERYAHGNWNPIMSEGYVDFIKQ